MEALLGLYLGLHQPLRFSLAMILQLILGINATYRLVNNLLADYSVIYRLRAQCMISKIFSLFFFSLFLVEEEC